MATDETPLHEHPQYLHGQLLALRALVTALADITTDRDTFQEAALRHLELLRTALLPEAVHDAKILAIDEMETYVQKL
jgi:hypothetical protein